MSQDLASPSPAMAPVTPVPIIRRRVDIDFSGATPENWYPGRLSSEQLLNAISFFFPAGEKFFIESVQCYQARITDPVLQDQVRRFIYQEAMHTREHQECNKLLTRTFAYGPWIDRLGTLILNTTRCLPKAYQLAVSCAIEHYTATMADSLLRTQDRFIERVQPAFSQLWLWHAVEETEHKAVCFDVYQHVMGKGLFAYLVRALAMAVTTLFFSLAVGIGLSLIKRADRRRRGRSATGEKPKVRSTFKEVASLIPLRSYLDYFRYTFHPWDHDNSELVAAWKQRFQHFGTSPDTP